MASAAIYIYMCMCVYMLILALKMFRFPKSVVPATPKIGCYPCLGARTCHFCCSQLLRLWGCSCSFLFFICHPWWHIQPLSQRRKKKKKTFKNPVTMKTFFDLSTTTMITAYRLTYTIIPQKKKNAFDPRSVPQFSYFKWPSSDHISNGQPPERLFEYPPSKSPGKWWHHTKPSQSAHPKQQVEPPNSRGFV